MISKFKQGFIFLILTLSLGLSACDIWGDDSSQEGSPQGSGSIILSFDRENYELSTKAVNGLRDTCAFLLDVVSSSGKVYYSGTYGNAGEKIDLPAGSYSLKVRSQDFTTPAFDSPLFSDEQIVSVSSGEKLRVRFVCQQSNSGVRIVCNDAFKNRYPAAALYLESQDGKLMYSVAEKRIAYFRPGVVNLLMSNEGNTSTLASRTLQPREILCFNLNCSSSGSVTSSDNSFKISIDTTRVWTGANIDLGGGGSGSGGGSGGGSLGSTKALAYSVNEAKENIGDEGCWVYGYIVGGDMTSSSTGINFETPFTSATNIAIAGRTSVDEKQSCMSVQLPTGAIRDALNLRDNPSNLGRKLWLKGDIVAAYYGIPGIKNITDYEIR